VFKENLNLSLRELSSESMSKPWNVWALLAGVVVVELSSYPN